MEIRLILFQEIGFGISWNNQANGLSRGYSCSEGKISFAIFPSSSKPNLHFAELHS